MTVAPVLLAGAAIGALAASRRVLRDWGATKAEASTTLPGDELVPEPAVVVTRAVEIEAPAAAVWPWLVQMGQDRGGLYSYDALENAVGLDIHSVDEIHPEWQHLDVGDEIRLVPRGWLGSRDGVTLPVVHLEPNRCLVLFSEQFGSVWSFHIHPVGADRVRLVSRGRSPRKGLASALADELIEPVTFAMTRRMLLGIKQRAERPVRQAAPTAAGTVGDERHERTGP